MTKTPEQMAEEYADDWHKDCDYPAEILRNTKKATETVFLAGYKAGQEHPFQFQTKMWVDSIGPQDRWISVKERLPEINKKVLVIFRNRIALAVIEENKDEFTKQGKFTVWKCLKLHKDDIYECYPWNDITHWMPLPEAPRE